MTQTTNKIELGPWYEYGKLNWSHMIDINIKLYGMSKFDMMTKYRSCLRRDKRWATGNMFLISAGDLVPTNDLCRSPLLILLWGSNVLPTFEFFLVWMLSIVFTYRMNMTLKVGETFFAVVFKLFADII